MRAVPSSWDHGPAHDGTTPGTALTDPQDGGTGRFEASTAFEPAAPCGPTTRNRHDRPAHPRSRPLRRDDRADARLAIPLPPARLPAHRRRPGLGLFDALFEIPGRLRRHAGIQPPTDERKRSQHNECDQPPFNATAQQTVHTQNSPTDSRITRKKCGFLRAGIPRCSSTATVRRIFCRAVISP